MKAIPLLLTVPVTPLTNDSHLCRGWGRVRCVCLFQRTNEQHQEEFLTQTSLGNGPLYHTLGSPGAP